MVWEAGRGKNDSTPYIKYLSRIVKYQAHQMFPAHLKLNQESRKKIRLFDHF